MYALDTNTCIYYLRDSFPALTRRLLATDPRTIAIPSMAAAELLTGMEKGARSVTGEIGERFLAEFDIISFNAAAARLYAKIRAYLEKRGAVIGPNDLVIAATVLARNDILVTHNVEEFRRVPGLQVEDWVL